VCTTRWSWPSAARAQITGAAFMKFGRAPSTCVMGARIASFLFTWTR
jgi:hypothetical protein